MSGMSDSPVRELRLALTVENFEQAVAFYRDALGLPELEAWDEPDGRGSILDAGRATLELLSVDQTARVDEVEVGRPGVSGAVRLWNRCAITHRRQGKSVTEPLFGSIVERDGWFKFVGLSNRL